MKKSLLAALLFFIGACASASTAQAGTLIPYPTPGVQNSETYTFVAAATGSITGYLYSANAADLDSIAMSVNGGPLSAFGIVNTSPVGTTFNFGDVTAGDKLTFVLLNATTGFQFSSNPGSNADLAQHVYSVDYTNPGPFAVAGIPTGTFVAFEDLLAGPPQNSDFDYNDDSFVFTNVGTVVTSGTPILGALPLFGSGLGLVGFLALRRKRKFGRIGS